ncbi:hypothetical protein CHS0354_038936 [Potamilus streckersoni]|uniref:Actin maturation protease n=1 Tax=Potamilus streckersoni TaxID=2493646 RepID=A0AAE0S0X7_9BIVA|nr:hypothetical protein CHS0354_038936 [Potamilus streckersoni]
MTAEIYVAVFPPPPPQPPCLLPVVAADVKKCPRGDLSQTTRASINKFSLESVGRRAYRYAADLILNPMSQYECLSFYRPVKPILQTGPQCGFVAMAMMGSLLKKDPTIDQVLSWSRDRGFTKQGELFSARCMEQIVKEMYACETSMIDVNTEAGRKDFFQHLLEGYVFLVPYDSDKNFAPVLKWGHKAHWALVTGYFLAYSKGFVKDLQQKSSFHVDSEISDLYHFDNPISVATNINDLQDISALIFVYGHQGKSRMTGIWSLTDLLDSCCNLLEIDPERIAKGEGDYVIPAGGIENELCGKVVAVHLEGHQMDS